MAPSPYIIVMSGGTRARKKHVRQSSIEITRRSATRSNSSSSVDETPSLDESTLDEEDDDVDVDAEFGEDETGNESSLQHAHVVLEGASTPIENAPSSQPVEVARYPSDILVAGQSQII